MWIYPGFSPSLSIYPINNQKAKFKPSRNMDYAGYSMETSCLLVNLKLIAFRFGVDGRWYILAFLLLEFCFTFHSQDCMMSRLFIHFIKEYTLSKHFQCALQTLIAFVLSRSISYGFSIFRRIKLHVENCNFPNWIMWDRWNVAGECNPLAEPQPSPMPSSIICCW